MFHASNLVKRKFQYYVQFILVLVTVQKFFLQGSITSLISTHPIIIGLLLLPFIYVITMNPIQRFYNNFFVITRYKFRDYLFKNKFTEIYSYAFAFVGIYFVFLFLASVSEWSAKLMTYMFLYFLFILSHYIIISTIIPFLEYFLKDEKLAILITMICSSGNAIFIYVNLMRDIVFDTYNPLYFIKISILNLSLSSIMFFYLLFKSENFQL